MAIDALISMRRDETRGEKETVRVCERERDRETSRNRNKIKWNKSSARTPIAHYEWFALIWLRSFDMPHAPKTRRQLSHSVVVDDVHRLDPNSHH